MSNELITVLGVTLITWLGVFVYIWRLDTRVSDLETFLHKKG